MEFDLEQPPKVQDGWMLYHGTTYANALLLASGERPASLRSQAESFLANYDLTLDDLSKSQAGVGMYTYVYEMKRDVTFSTTDQIEKAENYALRAPEWRYYAFQSIHSILYPACPEDAWLKMANEFYAGEPDPVVLSIKARAEVVDPKWADLSIYKGREVAISNPWPEGYELIGISKITRNQRIS